MVNKTETCWHWKGRPDKFGYGTFTSYKHEMPHRFSYELVHGKINNSDLEIHHKCQNKLCVNPDHMILVSSEEHGKITRELEKNETR